MIHHRQAHEHLQKKSLCVLQQAPSQRRSKQPRSNHGAEMTGRARFRWTVTTSGARWALLLSLRPRARVLNRRSRDAGAVLTLLIGQQFSRRIEHDIRTLNQISQHNPLSIAFIPKKGRGLTLYSALPECPS